MSNFSYVRLFSELGIGDVPLVGGKNASLGEMYRTLSGQAIQVPDGFATLAAAYYAFLDHNDLRGRITEALAQLDIADVRALATVGANIRGWIVDGEMPPEVAAEINAAYGTLRQKNGGKDPEVAVRSSATAEDLPDASFAGQQETYLNIQGEEHLQRSCKRVLASLFTDRAIAYRVHKGFDHMAVALSIGVQNMVRSDLASSGVMFSIDTESGFTDVVMVTAAYGLGENVVQGAVTPDEFLVYKNTLAEGFRPILRRQLGSKALKMVYSKDGITGAATRNVEVRREDRERFAITDDEVLQLARLAISIERHYGRPMDIEWAKDGRSGELFIVQARPETVHSNLDASKQQSYRLTETGKVLLTGKSVGARIGSGTVKTILDASHIADIEDGDVLVTDMTDPDWEPIMKRASAIVTNRGGRVCHAAIIARELGIPAIVGTVDATARLSDGRAVTVCCAEGETGKVYDGRLSFETVEFNLEAGIRPRTKIMMIVGNPGRALEFSRLPNDGVGLVRIEFIINDHIGVHPRALLDIDKLEPSLVSKIRERIAGYGNPREFYVSRLAEGIGTIAAAFYPKPVIVRMSDFKSNEYAQLLGGADYEPEEDNPMLGFRGASRYHSPRFADCFAMECDAVKRVRDIMGLANLELMIPFVRSVEEEINVMELMAEQGLNRGENVLRIHLMCEIPANALLAERFLEHCDGFSIGSNDLTQLALGVDRDSELLAEFDERNEAVATLMGMAIRACKKTGKYIGICGQAPSDFPEITRWLVEQDIESIALNPDSILKMTQLVLDVESGLARMTPQPNDSGTKQS
ncbi:MAG: phosphoenolpyruvate synthase [Haliea sp.]|uniref:phosphoenolpyruvate synthase n=1 Tax=Haliea sp. TaxID=1932666 RepID=UPI000C3662D8|nr:phosphoenolpyruvate synthase [Haliea sp.]MBM69774.1 phosphoenolpyruvate synthase [Haliea sp.]|tara:strand:+ start:14536 stop:16965 length:2430 start_codon:yes stop_codon:yes gene_type:complete